MAAVKNKTMTKERLKQYRPMKIEIQEIKYKLEHLGEGDTMVGNSVIMDYRKGYPQPQSVVGVDLEKINRTKQRYEKRLEKLERECEEIESLIDAIDDSRIRYIFELRFIEGKTQKEIGKKLYLEQSAVSKIIDNFLKMEYYS